MFMAKISLFLKEEQYTNNQKLHGHIVRTRHRRSPDYWWRFVLHHQAIVTINLIRNQPVIHFKYGIPSEKG